MLKVVKIKNSFSRWTPTSGQDSRGSSCEECENHFRFEAPQQGPDPVLPSRLHLSGGHDVLLEAGSEKDFNHSWTKKIHEECKDQINNTYMSRSI